MRWILKGPVCKIFFNGKPGIEGSPSDIFRAHSLLPLVLLVFPSQ